MQSPSPKFVFLDPSGRRWNRLRTGLLFIGILTFLLIVGFVRSLLVTPRLQFPKEVMQAQGQLKILQQLEPLPKSKPLWLQYQAKLRPQGITPPIRPASKPVTLGYYESWDPRSMDSLRTHASQLTHVAPEWFSITDVSGKLETEPDPKIVSFAAEKGLVLMPILNNLSGDTWQPEAVEGFLNGTQEARTAFIQKLLGAIRAMNAGGILLDWQQVDPAYQDALTGFIKEIADAFHASQKEVWLSIPLGNELKVFDLASLAPLVDRLVGQLQDENAEEDEPGPVASQDWFEGWLSTLLAYGQPQQWVISMGVYGYDWEVGGKKGLRLSFPEAMGQARDAGLDHVKLDAPTYNPHFSYLKENGKHKVWFLDAITFLMQARTALASQVGGLAINWLGAEDPLVWQALPLSRQEKISASSLDPLQNLKSDAMVTQQGAGAFLTLNNHREDGFRRIQPEENGHWTATYEHIPDYPTLYHAGANDPLAVALTFDDGPDPHWTPRILDILKEYHVPAAFFVVGSQAEQYPELVQRMYREGHEIGNHSYFHANLAAVSPERIHLEINVTQLLLDSILGRSTTLFRPPYHADTRPYNVEELKPIQIAQELGYVTVAEDIDPEDWDKPGATTIVQRVKQSRHEGNVILLHDGGGDRRQTVEALPMLIDYLQARGDRIASLSQMSGIPTEELMPPLPANEIPMARAVCGLGFRLLHAAEEFLWAFMVVATAIVLLRTLIVAGLACRHRWRHPAGLSQDFLPPLSVLVAAYNEEKVIQATLESVLQTDYSGDLEVIVVDDGSRDGTASTVERMTQHHAQIRLIRQPNAGKAMALRQALESARHEIVVMLDADTHFQRDTLRHLVAPLQDAGVGAVSGHARVGNLRTWIARFQSLEYICGFNLDRRAYHEWNCITVVPGAISAFRKSAIEAAGGLQTDTLAEDTDLTLSLHRHGYRIAYAPGAIAWTEAPETVLALTKQRFRWAFGTLQCLWKYRELMLSPEYRALGWFSLPSVWFCQILLVACVPLVDLALVVSLLFGGGSTLLIFFLIFLAVDLILAALAVVIEGESLAMAWLIIPMRVLYRPLLSWVVWRALLRAGRGALVGWGKLERTGSVKRTPVEV